MTSRFSFSVEYLSPLANWINALTNLYGLFILRLPILGIYKGYVLLAMAASILMHLSETKHHLKGIRPFTNFSKQFLLFDKIVSYSGVILVLYHVYILGLWSRVLILEALMGFSCLFMAEKVFVDKSLWNLILFVLNHTIWHITAYDIMYRVFKETINFHYA